MRVTPLLLEATVTRPVIAMPGGLNAAALLAWAKAEDMTLPPPKEQPAPIDLPIACLWRDNDGWPLWAATDFYPIGQTAVHRQWLHRRYPAHRAELASKLKVNLAAGPYKERRIPVQATVCDTWRAVVLAEDEDEVKRLIARVPALGARTAAGFGAVHAWRIEAVEADKDFVLDRRTVPVASGLRTGTPKRLPWTPPYWHASLWADCIEGRPCF